MTSHTVGMSRDDATRRVMLAVAIGPSRIDLPFTAADGSKPLVVTTPNEYFSEVVARVDAVGGSANIALAYARKFTIFIIESEPGENNVEDDHVVSRDLSMGMFWVKAKSHRGGLFRMRNSEAKIPAGSQDFAYAN